MSNSLDPDQARHFVVPDLGPNSLKRLSADDTSVTPPAVFPKSNFSPAEGFGLFFSHQDSFSHM